MPIIHPFFIQFQVRPKDKAMNLSLTSQGLATVIVYAKSESVARVLAGKIISKKNLEIINFSRIHLLRKSNIALFDNVLRCLHKQAELYGISLHCDFLKECSSCREKRQDQKPS